MLLLPRLPLCDGIFWPKKGKTNVILIKSLSYDLVITLYDSPPTFGNYHFRFVGVEAPPQMTIDQFHDRILLRRHRWMRGDQWRRNSSCDCRRSEGRNGIFGAISIRRVEREGSLICHLHGAHWGQWLEGHIECCVIHELGFLRRGNCVCEALFTPSFCACMHACVRACESACVQLHVVVDAHHTHTPSTLHWLRASRVAPCVARVVAFVLAGGVKAWNAKVGETKRALHISAHEKHHWPIRIAHRDACYVDALRGLDASNTMTFKVANNLTFTNLGVI